VHVFAGRVEAVAPPAGCTLHAITPADLPLAAALRAAPALLARSVRAAFAPGASGSTPGAFPPQ